MMDDENDEASSKAAAEKGATNAEAKSSADNPQKHQTGWGSPEKSGGQSGEKALAAREEEEGDEDEIPKGRRRNLRDHGSDSETEMVNARVRHYQPAHDDRWSPRYMVEGSFFSCIVANTLGVSDGSIAGDDDSRLRRG